MSRERDIQQTYPEWLADTKRVVSQPDLSEEEKKRPFAKYFYEEIPEPDPDHYAMMDEECDASKAITPLQMNELLKPGYLDIETGWCHLPDGTGMIANEIVYPEATGEMIDWWFAWHPLEDLRYRIWYPPQHGGIMVSPDRRARLLDDSIPMRERNWGVIHHVTENTNCGMEHVTIHFMSPQEFGFDMNEYHEPNVCAFAGGQGWSVAAVNEDGKVVTAPAIMCHIFRMTDEGLEHRTRFWLGWRFSHGKPEVSIPEGVQIPSAAIQGLARHNVCEFTRFRDFLPRIYKEFGHTMEV